MGSKLLCTFTNVDELEDTLVNIQDTYTLLYNYIYVLQNKLDSERLYVTYNIDNNVLISESLSDTILLHRKKETNTLYTINALNHLVKQENNGVLDKSFQINWNSIKNSIIMVNSEGYKKIPTRIFEIIDFK